MPSRSSRCIVLTHRLSMHRRKAVLHRRRCEGLYSKANSIKLTDQNHTGSSSCFAPLVPRNPTNFNQMMQPETVGYEGIWRVPIMMGRNLRIALLCCVASSCCGGCMIFIDKYWDTISSTGMTRYATASCHPIGGAPSTRGKSHERPPPCNNTPETKECRHARVWHQKNTLRTEIKPKKLTAFRLARLVGPASDGIQKNPSFRRPSSATFDNAL
jgi:hypothetical protein